jgi:hypothetical protein
MLGLFGVAAMRRRGLLLLRGIRSSPFLGQITYRGQTALRALTHSLSLRSTTLPVVLISIYLLIQIILT